MGAIRRIGVVVVVAALVSVLPVAVPPGTATAQEVAPRPTRSITQDAPDPEVLVVGDEWYLMSTNAPDANDTTGELDNVPTWISTDQGRTWQYEGDALPELGEWAATGWTWAPGTYAVDGDELVLYYTARDRRSGMQCIGVATSNRPAGPYHDARSRPLVCQHDLGGSIDADSFVDDDGVPYLLWKSDANNPDVAEAPQLWAQQLDAAGTTLTGEPTALLTGDLGDTGVIEGPSMFALPGGRVGLLYSAGWWESSGYRMHLARCATPLGPCTEVIGAHPTARPGGGGSVFVADDRLYIAFHDWVGPPTYTYGGRRDAYVQRLPAWLVAR